MEDSKTLIVSLKTCHVVLGYLQMVINWKMFANKSIFWIIWMFTIGYFTLGI